jgi:hypothetical protein
VPRPEDDHTPDDLEQHSRAPAPGQADPRLGEVPDDGGVHAAPAVDLHAAEQHQVDSAT